MKIPRPAPAAGARPVVRVVHPSGPVNEHLAALESGLAELESAGCEVRWDPERAQSEGRDYHAGSDQVRTDEFCQALTEPGVDVVWCARGGSGANRIADPVIRFAQEQSPRIVVGFSDATGLLNPLAQYAGWIVFHGPVVTTFGRSSPQCSLDDCLAVLRGETRKIALPAPASVSVTGRLYGGNLTVLASMVGTPTAAVPTPGALWLIEDVGEAPYRLDRAFWQLRQAGLFDHAAAVWVGDLDLTPPHTEQVIRCFAEDSALVTATGAPAGHKGQLAMLPIGGDIKLEKGTKWATGPSPWVEYHVG